MKKLLIYDHRGVLVLAANVFLEGVDFTQEYEEPVPIWIKSIYIVDEELEVLTLAEVAKRKVVLAITSLEESIENESKEADNQGIGDKGIDTAKQHEDAARILEEETRSHLDTRASLETGRQLRVAWEAGLTNPLQEAVGKRLSEIR